MTACYPVMLCWVPLLTLALAMACNSSHYGDVKMGAIASQITSLTIVYSTVYSDADQRKHQSSASLAFVWEIQRVNSPHKWPVTRKMFPFDDVIMIHGSTSIMVRWTTRVVITGGTELWQPRVPPITTKLALWQLNVSNVNWNASEVWSELLHPMTYMGVIAYPCQGIQYWFW